MTHIPVIGICAVRERARWSFWDAQAHLVADSYVASVRRTGAAVCLLPVDAGPASVLVDRIDALVLVGGSDIDPRWYGAALDAATESTFPDRDASELAMLHCAFNRQIPVLGICRGMQLINVAFGGSLVQDLAAVDGENPHRRNRGSFEGTEHEVSLEEGSLAHAAVGDTRHVARCHHHQAIGTVGSGLTVTARAADGVIEAIEARDARWVLGLQWHPEADERSRVFAALTEAAGTPAGTEAAGA